MSSNPNPTIIEAVSEDDETEAVGIRAQRLLSGPGACNITLGWMRGGAQGTVPLPTL